MTDPSALVRELRETPYTENRMTAIAAADLIESLQARIAELEGERGQEPCAWCGEMCDGIARHNDGGLHPSCGQPEHGFKFVEGSDQR